MNILTQLDRKYGKYAIKNIMIYFIVGYSVMWTIASFFSSFYFKYLSPDIQAILKGQVWRLITLIFTPPSFDDNILFLVINLYFLYFIGRLMENMWGSFALNLFFIVGYLSHIIIAFILYGVFDVNVGLSGGFMYGSYYLEMALFMLVGMSAPDMQVLLFFIIPLKMKWFAMLTMVILGGTVIFGFGYSFGIFKSIDFFIGLAKIGIYPMITTATSALLSLGLFFLFYALMKGYHISHAQKARKKAYTKKIKVSNQPRMHKCAVCGRTSEDESLSFRYCSKCNGTYEYCQDHLFTHEHKK